MLTAGQTYLLRNRMDVLKIINGKYSFHDSLFADSEDTWTAESLYKQAKKENAVAYKFPLKFYDYSVSRFQDISSVSDMVHHAKRVADADTSIPIILCKDGGVLDGYHRIVKATIDGDKFIMAYRLKEMPEPEAK